VQLGTAEDLYHRPANIFTAGFFSEINMFRQLWCPDGVAQTPVGPVEAGGFGEGTQVSVAVRLPGIEITETPCGVPARIVARRFLGVEELITLVVAGGEKPIDARIRAGQLRYGARDVSVTVNERDILVFERNG
jgi:iron(III) transport system ATP-binding protein